MRDYRVMVCTKHSDGSLHPQHIHEFTALDTRDARTAADIWVTGIETPGADSYLQLAIGRTVICRRPVGRMVWESLA